MNTRLSDSVEAALKLADGLVVVSANGQETTYSQKFACPDCGFTVEELEPRSFSFNSPFGACPECLGLGFKQEFDERLILPDDSKSLHGGAIRLLGFNLGAASWMRNFSTLCRKSTVFPAMCQCENCLNRRTIPSCTAMVENSWCAGWKTGAPTTQRGKE